MLRQALAAFAFLHFILTPGSPAAAAPRPPAIARLRGHPPALARLLLDPKEATLVGPRARQGFLVTGVYADGSRRDLTRQASYTTLRPAVARAGALPGSGRTLLPVGDGETFLKAVVAGKSASARITVREARRPAPVSFQNEVIPALTRAGCSQGVCHGAQHGKGGFKLSLLGYDPAADYSAITRHVGGRRVARTDPARSLLLLKPGLAVPHGGGLRLPRASSLYATLLEWLRDGAPGPDPKNPAVTGVAVLPAERTASPGETQQLVVQATYADGRVADVTTTARLTALNDAVASVDDAAVVKATGRGATAVMVRYMGQATVARVTVPYARLARFPDPPRENFIDELVAAQWRRMGLLPSPTCTDAEFIRRVYLDAIGTLPTPEEVRAFLAECEAERMSGRMDEWTNGRAVKRESVRREAAAPGTSTLAAAASTRPLVRSSTHSQAARRRLIDRVLARPEYVDYWALKWGDLLRNNRQQLGDKGMWSFYNWLRAAMRENRPVDALVRELVTAQGSTFANGPANFYRVARQPADLAETTSQLFLGVRLQCAKCHHHPYEKWSQDDYWSLAAFFARVGLKGSDEFGIFGGEQVVRVNAGGEVANPRTGKQMPPKPLDGPVGEDPVDRRRPLAEWLTAKENAVFARNWANRFWAYLMGRGIVDPVDDVRVTNPPSNPELLDALGREFVRTGFDQKALLRTIMYSRVYQLSARATKANAADTLFYTRYTLKRMPAEVLFDAVHAVTGTTEKFAQLPRGTRAISLPDPNVASYFLDTFGRPPRQVGCECERTGEPNLSQALHLMNGEALQEKIASPEGRLAKLVAAKKSEAEILDDLYLAAYGRPPRPDELARVRAAANPPPLANARSADLTLLVRASTGRCLPTADELSRLAQVLKYPSQQERLEDILWALLNSREFLFIH